MELSWAAVSALATLGGTAVTLIAFWLSFGDRISKAESTASSAGDRAEAALKSLAELHNRVTIESANMGLFRETVIGGYVRHDVLREMEDRIMLAVREGSAATAKQIGGLSERIDKALNGRVTRR